MRQKNKTRIKRTTKQERKREGQTDRQTNLRTTGMVETVSLKEKTMGRVARQSIVSQPEA
jgi:hypothetical protein